MIVNLIVIYCDAFLSSYPTRSRLSRNSNNGTKHPRRPLIDWLQSTTLVILLLVNWWFNSLRFRCPVVFDSAADRVFMSGSVQLDGFYEKNRSRIDFCGNNSATGAVAKNVLWKVLLGAINKENCIPLTFFIRVDGGREWRAHLISLLLASTGLCCSQASSQFTSLLCACKSSKSEKLWRGNFYRPPRYFTLLQPRIRN